MTQQPFWIMLNSPPEGELAVAKGWGGSAWVMRGRGRATRVQGTGGRASSCPYAEDKGA